VGVNLPKAIIKKDARYSMVMEVKIKGIGTAVVFIAAKPD